MTNHRVPITYVFDAYCGWCHGFAEAFASFAAEHADRIELTVISGGLFTGSRVVPMASLEFLKEANARINSLTGAVFSPANERLADDPEFRLDSTAAARGFAALRAQAPERSLEIAHAWQLAFFRDGQSLSRVETARETAAALGLDADAVAATLDDPASLRAAQDDFRLARTLGVDGYPTVLVRLPDGQLGRLGSAVSTAAELTQGFAQLLAASAARTH